MEKVIVISGGSSGIGLATAQIFAGYGAVVYELSRSGKNRGNIKHITVDIADEKQVEKAFRQIADEVSKIDVLINNAGYGISGATEFTNVEDARDLFNINFFGTLSCIQAALPLLRKSPAAKIINISSAAAIFAIPFQSFYSASKSAINSLSMALALELKPFAIQVCAVQPGDVKTPFTDRRDKSCVGEELYGESIAKSVEVMEKDEKNGMKPEKVAADIVKIANKRKIKPLYAIGGKYKWFAFLAKVMPTSLVNQVVGMLYLK